MMWGKYSHWCAFVLPWLTNDLHKYIHICIGHKYMAYIDQFWDGFLNSCQYQVMDLHISSLAFEIMLKSRICYHQIILVRLLSHHKLTAPESAWQLTKTQLLKWSQFSCLVRTRVRCTDRMNHTNQANRPEFILTEPNRLGVKSPLGIVECFHITRAENCIWNYLLSQRKPGAWSNWVSPCLNIAWQLSKTLLLNGNHITSLSRGVTHDVVFERALDILGKRSNQQVLIILDRVWGGGDQNLKGRCR